MASARRVIVIGAASSAGAHHAGQERAPDALRAGGFIERLEAAGLAVTDLGDVVRETFRVDRSGAAARNAAAVARVAAAVADAVERAAVEQTTGEDAVLVVLGGDCTVTLGVLAGLQRAEPDTGLIYFDGDADLATPGHGSGIFDAMGIAHLLGLTETELTGLFATRPPVDRERLAVLGYDDNDPSNFTPGNFGGMTAFPGAEVRADPDGCARAARDALAGARRLVVHFDVDAVDSGELPLGNFPHYGTGVSLGVARQILSVLFGAPRLAAVVLTEVNPGYDPEGDSLPRYIDAVAGALAAGLTGPG